MVIFLALSRTNAEQKNIRNLAKLEENCCSSLYFFYIIFSDQKLLIFFFSKKLCSPTTGRERDEHFLKQIKVVIFRTIFSLAPELKLDLSCMSAKSANFMRETARNVQKGTAFITEKIISSSSHHTFCTDF